MIFFNFSQLLESVFRPKLKENIFLETKRNFSLTRKCFLLTGKCFSLTNFYNGKQTHESLESGFPKTTFQETNTVVFLFFISIFFLNYFLSNIFEIF